MSNDPRDLDGKKLQQALLELGRNSDLREKFILWLSNIESSILYQGSVRDDIIGPIVDALHLDDDMYQKTLADGTKFEFLYRTKIARDFLLSKQEFPTHVWEPQTTRLLLYLSDKTSKDVLIGGAYFGDHAVLIGKNIQKDGRNLHCFEPNVVQSKMLIRNANINDLNNLIINNLGLWDKSNCRLQLDGFDSFANVVPAKLEEDGFETICIDDYSSEQECDVGLIMLDIEGAELRALKGAVQVMQKDKPSIVFEIHRDYVDWSKGLKETEICSLLFNMGYSLFAIRDFNGNEEMGNKKIELIPLDSVYLDGPAHGFNMLAIFDEEVINNNLFRIVKNVSPKLLKHKTPFLHHPTEDLIN